MKTAESNNAQLTGRIELDNNFKRRIPLYEQTDNLDRLLQKLSSATGGEFDKCECSSCELLRLWRRSDPTYRRRNEEKTEARQNEVMLRKLLEDD